MYFKSFNDTKKGLHILLWFLIQVHHIMMCFDSILLSWSLCYSRGAVSSCSSASFLLSLCPSWPSLGWQQTGPSVSFGRLPTAASAASSARGLFLPSCSQHDWPAGPAGKSPACLYYNTHTLTSCVVPWTSSIARESVLARRTRYTVRQKSLSG